MGTRFYRTDRTRRTLPRAGPHPPPRAIAGHEQRHALAPALLRKLGRVKHFTGRCGKAEPTEGGRPRRRRAPVWPLVVEGAVLALYFVAADGGVWRPRHVWGLALLLPATALWAWARAALGDAFTPKAEARTLVTRGPYARVRHPIYISAELVSAGSLIFIGWYWLLLLVAAVAIPVQVRRARREEQRLEAAFGDAYREYRRRTWF